MLFLCCLTYVLNFVFVEETQSIDEDPRKGATKVNELVHGEGHDTGSKDIILHPGVPSRPQSLGDIQIGIVFCDLIILAPVGGGGQHG